MPFEEIYAEIEKQWRTSCINGVLPDFILMDDATFDEFRTDWKGVKTEIVGQVVVNFPNSSDVRVYHIPKYERFIKVVAL